MAMIRHKTESIYRRYSIVDQAMLEMGTSKLEALQSGVADHEASGCLDAQEAVCFYFAIGDLRARSISASICCSLAPKNLLRSWRVVDSSIRACRSVKV